MKKNTPKINQGYDNMDDLREKVINGLACCSHMSGEFCRKCPYENECKEGLLSGSAHLAANALSLLKAQEPRLLTEADFVNADHYGYIPAWAEEKNGDQFWKIVRVASLGLEKKRLRYWTARPTDAQREAVKWE